MTRLWVVTALTSFGALITGAPAAAQIVTQGDRYALTIEGYANLTAGFADGLAPQDVDRDDDLLADLAVRALGQINFDDGPDLGLRLVAESSPGDRAQLAEASLLLFGGKGRLEFGERQGLPDVLTGYAPNNFTFTGAEFGPASGPSLDPGGGLQHAFLASNLAAQLDELAVLGFATSLFNDRSAKVLYVSPKRRGFLGGLSFSPDADDGRFGELVQAGLVHERYWAENVLRIGGSYGYAHATEQDVLSRRDLRSANIGATLVLNYLTLGVSATWNGQSGTERVAGRNISDAYGTTASLNYNHARWTVGGYVQWATAEGDARSSGNDRLAAAEAGLSYRFNTKLRIYGAWYYVDFDDEGGLTRTDGARGSVVLIGVRATYSFTQPLRTGVRTMSSTTRTRHALLAAAITSLVAASASAQVHPERPTYAYEKCYGIAKAGKNDCFFAANSCAGTAERDSEPGAWIYVPKGTCQRIVGGNTAPPKASTADRTRGHARCVITARCSASPTALQRSSNQGLDPAGTDRRLGRYQVIVIRGDVGPPGLLTLLCPAHRESGNDRLRPCKD